MLASVLFTFQTIVNMFWVGKLGSLEMAAVSLSGSTLGVFQSLAGIVAAGTLATCARFSGANDRNGIIESLSHSLVLTFAFGGILALAAVPFSDLLLRLFGAEPKVVSLGEPFLTVLLAMLPVFFVSIVLASVFQAFGDTRTPMWVALAVNVVNLILDPLLILGWFGFPRLGILGAAIATAISQALSVVALLIILARRNLVRLNLPVRFRYFAILMGIGVPASLQAITRPLTGQLMFRIVASFGSPAIAAFGIGLRLLNIMYIYLGGLTTACQSLVGQNLGARRPEDAVRVATRVQLIALGLQLVILTALFILAPQVTRIFNADPGIVRYGTSYLRVLAPFLVIVGLSSAWSGAQYGAGDTKPTMFAAVIANWLVKLPFAYILAKMTSMRLTGVWLGIGLSIVAEAVILGITYYRGGWRRKELAWRS